MTDRDDGTIREARGWLLSGVAPAAVCLAIVALTSVGAATSTAIVGGALAGIVAAVAVERRRARARAADAAAYAAAIDTLKASDDVESMAAFRGGGWEGVTRAVEAGFRQAVTQREELTRDRARLSAVLAGMVEGVVVVSAGGQVELLNEAARQMLRLQASTLGRRYADVIRHPDIATQVGDALAGQHPAGVELALARDPEQILVARAAPVGDGGQGALLVLHDITDLRRADRIRRDFIANVSHELRTPLTAIRGYVEALLDSADDPADRARFLAIIDRHSSRMETLVKDLLRLARLDAGQEELDVHPCPTDALYAGVVTELRPTLEARRQQVLTHIAPDATTVVGDAAKLHEIVRNLTENASNYSPERSTITLDAWRETSHIILRVSDEGPGIPDTDLERIFERFYRVDKARSRETGGTGLGLSIVKHLVELHGGTVVARNHKGGGAQFIVTLPG